jgi:hypothetical protein
MKDLVGTEVLTATVARDTDLRFNVGSFASSTDVAEWSASIKRGPLGGLREASVSEGAEHSQERGSQDEILNRMVSTPFRIVVGDVQTLGEARIEGLPAGTKDATTAANALAAHVRTSKELLALVQQRDGELGVAHLRYEAEFPKLEKNGAVGSDVEHDLPHTTNGHATQLSHANYALSGPDDQVVQMYKQPSQKLTDAGKARDAAREELAVLNEAKSKGPAEGYARHRLQNHVNDWADRQRTNELYEGEPHQLAVGQLRLNMPSPQDLDARIAAATTRLQVTQAEVDRLDAAFKATPMPTSVAIAFHPQLGETQHVAQPTISHLDLTSRHEDPITAPAAPGRSSPEWLVRSDQQGSSDYGAAQLLPPPSTEAATFVAVPVRDSDPRIPLPTQESTVTRPADGLPPSLQDHTVIWDSHDKSLLGLYAPDGVLAFDPKAAPQ